MAGAKHEDPLPALPRRAVNDEAWEQFMRDPNFVAHRWSDADAAVLRFQIGGGPLIVLGSVPARTVVGEESVAFATLGDINRLGEELATNGAGLLLPHTVIDGIFLDISRPEPSPYVMVFDLVRYRGESLAKRPYAERVALLGQVCDELQEAGAWPSDWVQAGPVPALASARWQLFERNMVLRDMRAPLGAAHAAIVAPRRR